MFHSWTTLFDRHLNDCIIILQNYQSGLACRSGDVTWYVINIEHIICYVNVTLIGGCFTDTA